MTLQNFSTYFYDCTTNKKILINLSSSDSKKNLSVSFLINFLTKIRNKYKSNHKIIIIWKQPFKNLIDLEKKFTNIQIIKSKINIYDLFCLIRSCDIVFSADTGISHIAISFGIRTICLCNYNFYFFPIDKIYANNSYYLCRFLNYNFDNFYLIFTQGIFEKEIFNNKDLFNFKKITFYKNCQEIPLKNLIKTLIKFINF